MTLGFSSCPNDTYIFDALIHGRIQSPYSFDVRIHDVEELNQLAFERALDLTKISIHAWFHLLDKYDLLTSGGAMGRGCGPLLIAPQAGEIKSGKIALPGKYTTANLLFHSAIEGDFEPVYMRFDKIIPAILNREVQAGVIIHESRFTYQETGLSKILDLGEWWEETTGYPIPLGGILVERTLPLSDKQWIASSIRESIRHARTSPEESLPYIREHAQELSDQVTQSHIDLYVNDFSLDFGEEGKAAIKRLHEAYRASALFEEGQTELKDEFFI